MSSYQATTLAERYDQAVIWAHDRDLAPDVPRPQLTCDWPPENVCLLEEYQQWLLDGGASPFTVNLIYIPAAGHVLGLALKPHPQLDLDADFQKAIDFIRAKRQSAIWTKNGCCGVKKFQRFLRERRGLPDLPAPEVNVERYRQGLPEWLLAELERYQHLLSSHWRPTRLSQNIRRFWASYTRVWHWLVLHHPMTSVKDIKRRQILDYVDAQLAAGQSVKTINTAVRNFRSLLLFLQENDHPVPLALLRMRDLKPPDALPRFLTDEQVLKLREAVEADVRTAEGPHFRRDVLLTRAAFYLLWQSALRIGEVEDLKLEDVDLAGRKLVVRQGKGRRDRTVYLSDTTVQALTAYLAVRGPSGSGQVFMYRNRPVNKDLLRQRVKAAGARVGVAVSPHRLRHTCATQLLNAGCRVTSIQQLLGHKRLNSTMIYARVHDQTVAADYYAAMASIEQRLKLIPIFHSDEQTAWPDQRTVLLEIVMALGQPDLNTIDRLRLAEKAKSILTSVVVITCGGALTQRSQVLPSTVAPTSSPQSPGCQYDVGSPLGKAAPFVLVSQTRVVEPAEPP